MKAFPWQERLNSDDPNVLNPVPHGGMDLRDYFAAKAMEGLVCDRGKIEGQGLDWNLDIQILSEMSYEIADAMMKAREA
jgi:hypothetical protein